MADFDYTQLVEETFDFDTPTGFADEIEDDYVIDLDLANELFFE